MPNYDTRRMDYTSYYPAPLGLLHGSVVILFMRLGLCCYALRPGSGSKSGAGPVDVATVSGAHISLYGDTSLSLAYSNAPLRHGFRLFGAVGTLLWLSLPVDYLFRRVILQIRRWPC